MFEVVILLGFVGVNEYDGTSSREANRGTDVRSFMVEVGVARTESFWKFFSFSLRRVVYSSLD